MSSYVPKRYISMIMKMKSQEHSKKMKEIGTLKDYLHYVLIAHAYQKYLTNY